MDLRLYCLFKWIVSADKSAICMGIIMKKRVGFLLLILILLLNGLCGCSSEQETVSTPETVNIPETVNKRDPEKIVIVLLDTGVSEEAIENKYLLPGYNYLTDSDDTSDKINHGTAVASTILGSESAGVKGAAQGAYLVPLVVVTEENGETVSASPEILAKAIRDSVDIYNGDIINVSLGINKDDASLSEAIEYAEKKGVLVVSAVGNGGEEGKPYYPAAYDTVLAVGSCDKNGNKSVFTQRGADILAQGEGIRLASKNGKTYGAKGTSYATGYVSANAAKLLMENPSLTPEEIREVLIQKACSRGGYLPIEE